jgi:molybdate transport system substrate-binding protein
MFTVAQPARLEHRLADGGRADVLILPAPVIARLTRSGMVRAGSTIALARVGIGVVVRQGAASPDISTAAAIRKLLLDAHSIVYPDPEVGGGYTGRTIARMIDGMDIAAVVKPKLTLRSAIGGGVELVARGQVEVGLFNISEIIPIKGVTLVGPLPAELQSYIVFSAAITANSSTPKPDVAFIRMLAGPLARNAWEKAGLELMAKAPAQAQ